MAAPYSICFASSEIAPFAKTGGLADVTAALAKHLHRRGHDVRPFLPFYGAVAREGRAFHPVEFARDVPVPLGARTVRFTLWTAPLGPDGPPVYLVECPEMFARPRIYSEDWDEPERFVLFSRAVLESCQRMGWAPDVFHCHDWHTALVPLLLRTLYGWDSLFRRSRTLLTIHNIGYQGVWGTDRLDALGLAPWAERFDASERHAGRINFLRTGIEQADLLSTVSPTHAREIQTDEYGMGLGAVLRARARHLVGILNGIDEDEWDPSRDRFLPHPYSSRRLAGKAHNKADLIRAMGLTSPDGAPLAGIVSRLIPQKGFDLCVPVLPEVLARSDLRLVVLGSGEARYEGFFEALRRRAPGRVGFYRGYHEELAHRIEAGADLFLMPSQYEPCGLNQMFSQTYGTIPVVRRTGGLADSVEPWDPSAGTGTGFVFEHYTADGLRWALARALDTWRDRAAWRRLVRNAMAQDFSWTSRTDRYLELYARLAG